jgi:hypothetical protein
MSTPLQIRPFAPAVDPAWSNSAPHAPAILGACVLVMSLGLPIPASADPAAATMVAAQSSTRLSMAEKSHVVAGSPAPGVTPFIAFIPLSGVDVAHVRTVRFTIAAAPGSASRPVSVSYTMDYLARRGYAAPPRQTMTLPVFALYPDAVNSVKIRFKYRDKSTSTLPVTVTTGPYADPCGIYDRPVIVHARAPGAPLGFDFFFMKSSLGSPVIVDSDGRIRWAVPDVAGSYASTFTDNGFVVGSPKSLQITRVELDGDITQPAVLQTPDGTNFSHSVDIGKQGLMGEIDAIAGVSPDVAGDQKELRSTANDFDPTTGGEYKEWNFVDILADYMRSQGDDPALFVRPDVDWFHMNMVFYDASDNSVIVSSRENFVMKIDYATSAIKWIFGDPAKYWYTFPSLRARSLALTPGGLVPIGQHSTTIAPDGNLLLFNNGTPSFNQPQGAPVGTKRTYSAVSAYTIDEAHMTVTQRWVFDYGRTLLSPMCSSARQLADGSVLVDYAQAADKTQTHIVGLNPAHEVVFDYQYLNSRGCQTSWNAQPIALDQLTMD